MDKVQYLIRQCHIFLHVGVIFRFSPSHSRREVKAMKKHHPVARAADECILGGEVIYLSKDLTI